MANNNFHASDQLPDDNNVYNDLTHLPDDILMEILSNLPPRVLVRSMTWNKEMVEKWRETPRVKIDQDDSEPKWTWYPFEDFVEEFLKRRNSLPQLSLRFRSVEPERVQEWITRAVNLGVKNLEIVAAGKTKPHALLPPQYILLPPQLFAAQRLEILTVKGLPLKIDTTGELVSLPQIKSLQLVDIDFQSPECLRRLVAGGNRLRSLGIVMNHGHVLELPIQSNSLQSIVIRLPECLKCTTLMFTTTLMFDTPDLRVLSIHAAGLTRLCSAQQKMSCTSLMINTGRGSVRSSPAQNLESGSPCSFEVDFPSLMRLVVEGFSRRAIHKLLALSPALTFLKVVSGNLLHEQKKQLESLSSWQPDEVPRCLNTLEEICIVRFGGHSGELRFLSFMLANGAALRLVCVNIQPTFLHTRLMLELLVSALPKASECTIVFT